MVTVGLLRHEHYVRGWQNMNQDFYQHSERSCLMACLLEKLLLQEDGTTATRAEVLQLLAHTGESRRKKKKKKVQRELFELAFKRRLGCTVLNRLSR